MNITKVGISLLAFTFVLLSAVPSFSGASLNVPTSLRADRTLIGFFDLRERETYIQVTNVASDPNGNNIHIQIFDVSNNCNENDFFDNYTPSDTHVYNLADIQTNDGNPSGVVLPDDAYGIIYVTYTVGSPGQKTLVGNIRILDNNGYEYRTNLNNTNQDLEQEIFPNPITFNFNSNNGVILSDIVGIVSDRLSVFNEDEVQAADIVNIWKSYDIDIIDNNEVPFSCRDVVFACTDQDNPLLEALLEDSGVSVASFEYGINNAIPHSKGGELLCPGNTITEGIVSLNRENNGEDADNQFVLFTGLNNGNGRGSIDSAWYTNPTIEGN